MPSPQAFSAATSSAAVTCSTPAGGLVTASMNSARFSSRERYCTSTQRTFGGMSYKSSEGASESQAMWMMPKLNPGL
ncbi:hypothetical protein C1Y63_06690 [Corynebacterium sp. 13CS0277]|nr:hypothetical protein C1Y63_06690 [Corynebacterium sp. 13CS0277]